MGMGVELLKMIHKCHLSTLDCKKLSQVLTGGHSLIVVMKAMSVADLLPLHLACCPGVTVPVDHIVKSLNILFAQLVIIHYTHHFC